MNGRHAANGEFFLVSMILLIVVVVSKPVSSVEILSSLSHLSRNSPALSSSTAGKQLNFSGAGILIVRL
jgi:hypothetical protein